MTRDMLTADDIDALLTLYPRAKNIELTGFLGATRETPRGWGVPVAFQERDAAGQVVRQLNLGEVLREYRYTDEDWLIPRVGAGDDYLHPLLLWWVLLFALSLLARYEPARWRAALDIETPLAVPLEDLMDEALVAVPHWVLWALLDQPFRLTRTG